jgi:hypothetical protein
VAVQIIEGLGRATQLRHLRSGRPVKQQQGDTDAEDEGGPFDRARGVASIRTTPVIGIGIGPSVMPTPKGLADRFAHRMQIIVFSERGRERPRLTPPAEPARPLAN